MLKPAHKKVLAFIGEAVGFFIVMPSTLLGWIPHFTGMSMGYFFVLDALLAVMFACMIME